MSISLDIAVFEVWGVFLTLGLGTTIAITDVMVCNGASTVDTGRYQSSHAQPSPKSEAVSQILKLALALQPWEAAWPHAKTPASC